jgi:hypothetical protein
LEPAAHAATSRTAAIRTATDSVRMRGVIRGTRNRLGAGSVPVF